MLRAGLSGCGAAGKQAVHAVRQHGHCDIVALHDPDADALRALQQDTGINRGTTDFRELLATGVDFVVLAGPPGVRREQVHIAAEQVVHCLVHAPMASSLADASAMLATTDAASLKLGVAVSGHDDPVFEQIRRMIGADWFGGLVSVQAIWGEDDLLRAPPRPNCWQLQPDLAGHDPLLRLAANHVHLASWLTGRAALRVTAQAAGGLLPLAHDTAVATAVLRGNVLCTFAASHLYRSRSFMLLGTDGSVRIDGDRICVRGEKPFTGDVFDYAAPGTDTVWTRADLEPQLAKHAGAHELHGRFARWIDDLDDFPCTGEQAIADLRTLDAMARAAVSGKTETV